MRPKNYISLKRNSLYRKIVDYKINNDGNTPCLRKMLGWQIYKSVSSLRYALAVLEEAGLLEITSKKRDDIHINLVGGKYLFEGRVE